MPPMMHRRESMLLKKQRAQRQARQYLSLSQICMLLLCVLVIFYISVASYLIPSAKHPRGYHNDPDPGFVQLPELPKFADFKVPNPHHNDTENRKYAPPESPDKPQEVHPVEPAPDPIPPKPNDADKNDDRTTTESAKSESNPNAPSKSLAVDDYNKSTAYYKDQCPPKYPDKVPSLNTLNHICSHLNDFDVRWYQLCGLDNCTLCVPPTSMRMTTENEQTRSYQKQFVSEKESRRESIRSMISHIEPGDGPIILMVFNHGYAWLFYNLLCSLEFNGIDIKNRTIIVTTDKMSEELVQSTGFNAHYPEWLGEGILKRITHKAAQSFALGAHKWIVSIQIALITDLIEMGYDVIMQDIDLIWYKSPIPWLMQPQFEFVDIQMSVDGNVVMPDDAGKVHELHWNVYALTVHCKCSVSEQLQ